MLREKESLWTCGTMMVSAACLSIVDGETPFDG